jgi:DNA-binding LacI/PurR family transcriptional regulator
MKEVANLARVSVATVSRVVSGSDKISAETQTRVRDAMRALNYHPNAIARSLARSSTHTIGLVVERSPEAAFANPFFPEVLRGIGGVIQKAGYQLLLIMGDDPEAERKACMHILHSRRVDGVILTSSRVEDDLIKDLLTEGMQFVVIGRVTEHGPVCYVNNDNVQVGFEACNHLIEAGYRRIAMINGPREQIVSVDRFAGYQRALRDGGLPAYPDYVVEGSFSRESGKEAARTLLTLASPPDAIFAADDAMAVGVLEAARELGVSVPKELGIIGVNDDPLTSLIEPSLSTVRIPILELGARAADLLLTELDSGASGLGPVILPGELVARQSTMRIAMVRKEADASL